LEIRQLKTFKTVATLLSFTQAAQHLNYAQSSISAQIQALEDELAVKLFDRLGRRILLTEAGERLLLYAGKLLDLAEETRTDVAEASQPQGSLTIRVPETLGVHYLPPVIKRFQRRFPQVGLLFTTCAHEGLQKDLRKGLTDLAFIMADSIQAADLVSEALGFESLMVVAHPQHPLAAKTVVRTRDFHGQTLLLSRVDCSYRRVFQQALAQADVRPGGLLEFNSIAAIKQCVMEGIGITIMPQVAVAEEIAAGRLAPLAWEEGPLETALLMIWYKEKWLSPTLTAFMEMVRATFDKQLNIADGL